MDPQAARAFILAELRGRLPVNRSYHSLAHTLDVYASTISIAEEEGITGEPLDLLKTAALFHDSGFMDMPGDHEQGSCIFARAHLPRFGYTKEQIGTVCALIMATKIPQHPFDKLSEVLCDADLDYLGRDDFHTIGNLLFQEMKSHGALTTRREWNELQEKFLARHTYFTETNRRVRGEKKKAHLAWVRQWLRDNP
ncbi:MAG: phosphohydrolase [Bacteroidetes bacterium]|nr:phosphohydrolase [Bacteroidota bacterium]